MMNCMHIVLGWATVRQLLVWEAVSLFLYMTIWYLLAVRKGRLDVVDTAWGGSFVLAGWLSVMKHYSPSTLLAAVLVTIWGARLMYYMWWRHKKKDQDDPRYTQLSAGWKRAFWLQVYLKIFILQGILAALVAAPLTLNVQAAGIGWVAIVGVLVWVAGFGFEAVGDYQLKQFLARPNRKKKVMDEGLWRYTRHPNYFGESVQWFGLGILALAAPWGWLGLIGPILITVLLVFVSGIPTVEKGKDKDPDWREYMRRVSPFIPLPPRR